ncbi:hypothetical protein N7517_008309 [Penicillium concentricum]|uniref:Uncharacterized protein n=1 Tax=Penicillium concentricum TaxID=293559 RepID=A0A9W9V1K5_9EURO|nr:uncharacterized protein N7517_008309 [Penicillium concentricum]KAJ5365423.1 hypothetical protein N7517_008309 [Penicillium concentricum]
MSTRSDSSEPSRASRSHEASQTPNLPKPKVPQTSKEWQECSSKLAEDDPTLHTLQGIHSASKLTALDFTSMRAIWPKLRKPERFPMMQDFPELDAYIERVGQPHYNTEPVYRDMGAFLLVRQSQSKINLEPASHGERPESDSVNMQPSLSKTPERRETSKPDYFGMDSESGRFSDISAIFRSEIKIEQTNDEQLVNDALIFFTKAVLVYQSQIRCQWTSERSLLSQAVFGNNTMNARTDGYLEADKEVFAIVEVKPNTRDPVNRPALLWQETGEMVVWIMHDQKHERKYNLRRRLIVSQDNHEIFLTIASYDNQYLTYLKTGDTSEPSGTGGSGNHPFKPPFLKLQTYGPWSIIHPSHMHSLATIILCVAFEVTDDLNSASPVGP